MTQYHIDTDMGVDDGLALVLASQLVGRALLSISTVFGNVPVEAATRNARIFRRLLGLQDRVDILVGAGQASDGYFCDARKIHGDDGLGNATRSLAPALLGDIETDGRVKDIASVGPPKDGPITIIGLGPATNLPDLVGRFGSANVEQIVLMSGVFLDAGNVTPIAEFNSHCDPAALERTLALGIPVTIVPLDVCRKIQLSRRAVEAYLSRDASPLTQLIVRSHMPYMDYYRQWEGIDGCFPHDAIAVFAAVKPALFFRQPARVRIECFGEARGRTSLSFDPASHVSVVFGGSLKEVRESIENFTASA
jgi:inosine-uridine nucleoside N-ribohydrolase